MFWGFDRLNTAQSRLFSSLCAMSFWEYAKGVTILIDGVGAEMMQNDGLVVLVR